MPEQAPKRNCQTKGLVRAISGRDLKVELRHPRTGQGRVRGNKPASFESLSNAAGASITCKRVDVHDAPTCTARVLAAYDSATDMLEPFASNSVLNCRMYGTGSLIALRTASTTSVRLKAPAGAAELLMVLAGADAVAAAA